ncbi:MAG TPA: DivIVA domain-containing protein [bacterium]|jgi:cell division initiation protein|nr:DivIVA domain-containing protein [bacterium]
MLTPLDIQKKEFRRRLRGYCEEEVDEFLDQILADYEMLYRQNASLKDQVSRLQEETGRYHNLEETLQNTLVLAQKAADETRANAQKEADLIQAEAEANVRQLEEEGRRRLANLMLQQRDLAARIEEYKARTKALLLGAISLLEAKERLGEGAEPNANEEVAASCG